MGLFAAVVIDVFEVERMYMTRKVSQNCQANVDKQIYNMSARLWMDHFWNQSMEMELTHATSCHCPHTQRRDYIQLSASLSFCWRF